MCLPPRSEKSRRKRGAIRETRERGGRDGQTRWSSTSLGSKNGRGSVSGSRVRRDALPEHQVSLLSLLDSRSICFGDVPLRSGIHRRENVYRWPLGHEEESTDMKRPSHALRRRIICRSQKIKFSLDLQVIILNIQSFVI